MKTFLIGFLSGIIFFLIIIAIRKYIKDLKEVKKIGGKNG